MIRAVIFDFNGVLVDDEPVHFELFRDVLAEIGIALSERQYHEEYLGYDDRGCFAAALRAAGRPAEAARVDELIAQKARLYADWAERGLRSFPGAPESVATLAAHYPVAICSGALRAEIEFALARLGVDGRITAIVAAEDTDRCKPDPQGYLLALAALRSAGAAGLEAAHCLVIEDSLAGVQSAKGAGMRAVGVTHTYGAEELRRAGADAVLEDLRTLDPAWIDRTFRREEAT